MASKSSIAALVTTADPEVDVLGAKAAAELIRRERMESFMVDRYMVIGNWGKPFATQLFSKKLRKQYYVLEFERHSTLK